MRKVFRGVGLVLAAVMALAAAGVGVLQTGPGQDFLAAAIARMASRPDAVWAIDGLSGAVPFRMAARQIRISDRGGVWLSLRDVRLDIDPARLLVGELHVRLMRAAEVDKARPAAGPSTPLAEFLRVPHLPLALVVDRLAIGRLVLEPPNLGARVVASVAGDAAVSGTKANADLDIHRIDALPGNLALHTTLAGVEPRLNLRLQASDPTGILLDGLLARTDRLPLTLAAEGDGPVSDWHGRLTAEAGTKAKIDARLMLAVASETAIGMSVRAAVAPLLPPALAPLIGDEATLSAHAIFGDRIIIDRLSFATASGTAAGDAVLGEAGKPVEAHLRADLPDLSNLDGLTGGGFRGSAAITAALSGSEHRPILNVDLSASAMSAFGAAVHSIEAHAAATPTGALGDANTRIALDARGRLAGIAVPKAGRLTAPLSSGIEWALSARAEPDAHALELARFDLRGGGIDLNGAGHLALAARGAVGNVHFTGAASGLRTGVAAADALLGGTPTLAGSIRLDEGGVVSLDALTLTGAAAKLAGSAEFNPDSRAVVATLSADIPRLEALRPALRADIAGAVSAEVDARGPVDRLRLETKIDGRKLVAGGISVDRVQLSGAIADLSQPKAAIEGGFRAGGLDGKLTSTAAPIGDSGLAVSNLKLTAADSTITGDLRIVFASGLVQGSLAGRFPDLSRWSALAGQPFGGSLNLTAGLATAGGGQGLNLTLDGTHLAAGSGASRTEMGRLAVAARLTDLWRSPAGTGRLSLSAVHSSAVDFATATATVDSRGPGQFAFQGNAAGQPLSVAFAGDGSLATASAELRLSRLTGSLGNEHFAIAQPFALSRRGSDLALSGLALRLGHGRITATGSVRGEALAFTANAADLPIAAGARLLGYPGIHGELSLAATFGGSLRSPQGRLTVNAAGLSLATSRQAQTPRLGLTVEGSWNGRTVDLNGQVTGLRGDRMAITGSLPLLLNPAPIGISVPRQGRLALSLRGGGDIGHLADLLPLGEDRLSGEFTADVSVGGTVAAPSASGRLRLLNARYENLESGAVLKDLSADLVGNGDRFQLAALSAGDGAGGSLKAQGSLVLRGTEGPSAQLSATLANFRVAARDEGLATASGTVSVTGPVTALKITAPLTIDRAAINLPNSLPPSVVVLNVTEVNGQKRPGSQPQAAAAPALPAVLDISLRLSGPVLVQGHGLDSQWRGRLTITGTTAAPKIAGGLVASRGSYALLGKSFRLTRGTITFDGTAHIDPALDIVAEASAADITADVTIGGFASAPTVSLSSTPPLPRDEILARLLFGTGVRQITAGQGLELAQAAAALSGGGVGVLERLRGGLGLDWLRLGQGPAGAASSILNPSVVTPTTASTAALSAGKYIAPGVSIGVTQGVSPPTSKVTVEVDLGHHVTVDTEAGQNNGTGIGLNYNYDY